MTERGARRGEESHHVSDDRDVDRQGSDFQSAGVVDDFVALKGNVDRTAQRREPLGPAAGFPQTVGFDKTKRGVERGKSGDPPQAGVGDVGHRVNENLRVMTRGVQVETRDEVLGQERGVLSEKI